MIRSLWIAKTGLEAQQTQMDVISNNLANVSTNGFKRSRAVFEDLLYQNMRQPGAQSSQQTQIPSGLQIGTGVRPIAAERIHTQGNLQQTGNQLDVAIQGAGFFQVLLPDGTTAYTRDGAFQTDSQGQLVTSNGFVVQPAITIPANATSVTIGQDGVVTVTQAGAAAPVQVGSMQLATFINPAGLESMGQNLYHGNCIVRHAQHQRAGYERDRDSESGLCRNIQRERGGRTGEHDPDAARVRDQFQGDHRLGSDVAETDADVSEVDHA